MNIQLLLTGNELMAGHTIDSNSALIAEKLSVKGYAIDRKVTIGDDFDQLVSEIIHLSENSQVLVVNGGLGPTLDDLTAQALATAAKQDLTEHQEAILHLEQWCKAKKLKLNDANRKQALLPEQAKVIHNPIGSAVGFSLDINDCLVICTPGVPSELKAMLDDSIVETISRHIPLEHSSYTLRWQTYGIGESTLQQLINNQFPDWPDQVEIGFRAGLPLLEIKFTVQQTADIPLLEHWAQQLRQVVGDSVVCEGDGSLPQTVTELLQQQKLTLTTAESCTGGLIASQITKIAGASLCFEAGFVTYSNPIKQSVLNVPEKILETEGAVSEAVVRAMAEGALNKSGGDYTIAVSGIAGPDGGSAEKPVGTVWIAWGNRQNIQAVELNFNGERRWFQIMVAATALDLIRRQLLSITEEPRYFKRRKVK